MNPDQIGDRIDKFAQLPVLGVILKGIPGIVDPGFAVFIENCQPSDLIDLYNFLAELHILLSSITLNQIPEWWSTQYTISPEQAVEKTRLYQRHLLLHMQGKGMIANK